MKQKSMIALCGRIREKANKFIIYELKKCGIEGIVPSHGDILQILFDGKVYSMAEISEKIYRSKATVSVLVEKLEKTGYVKRSKDENDARVININITETGLELKPIFMDISKRLNKIVYDGFSDTEAGYIEILLRKSVANFKI